jgi:hypothetical protein
MLLIFWLIKQLTIRLELVLTLSVIRSEQIIQVKRIIKTLPIFLASSSLEMYGIRINALNTDVNIHKNVISGHRSWAVSVTNSDFTITGNYIGTNKTGTN